MINDLAIFILSAFFLALVLPLMPLFSGGQSIKDLKKSEVKLYIKLFFLCFVCLVPVVLYVYLVGLFME